MAMVTIMTEDALAKPYRGAVVELLDSDNHSNVIGIEPVLPRQTKSDSAVSDGKDVEWQEEGRLLSIVTTDELIDNICQALCDPQNHARLISSIANIEPFEPHSSGYNPGNKVYHVRLIDYQDRCKNQMAQMLFRNQCDINGIIIEKESRYSSYMKLYRVFLDRAALMESVCNFEGVFSIEEAIPVRADMDLMI